MQFYKVLLRLLLLTTLIVPSGYAATKRVIDQGMLDGQRRYIIACNNGKQMYFIKKFTASEQEAADSGAESPRGSKNPVSVNTSEFIESCLQTQDDRGDFCRSDTEWSARDAGAEFCQ